jgi:hypothetical protein
MYIPSGITVSVGHTRFQPWMKPPACESTDKFGNKIYFSDGVTKMNWNRLTEKGTKCENQKKKNDPVRSQ